MKSTLFPLILPRDTNGISVLLESLSCVLLWYHIQIKELRLGNANSWQRYQREVILFLKFLQSGTLRNGYPESEQGENTRTHTHTHTHSL